MILKAANGRLFLFCVLSALGRCVLATQRNPALDAGAAVFVAVNDEVKITTKIATRCAQRNEAAAPECFLQRDSRNTADPQPGLNGSLDRFSVLQLEHDIEIRQYSVHRTVERLAGSRPCFA